MLLSCNNYSTPTSRNCHLTSKIRMIAPRQLPRELLRREEQMQVFQIQVQSKYFILNQLQIRHTYSFKIQFILFKPKITSIVFLKRQNNPSTCLPHEAKQTLPKQQLRNKFQLSNALPLAHKTTIDSAGRGLPTCFHIKS